MKRNHVIFLALAAFSTYSCQKDFGPTPDNKALLAPGLQKSSQADKMNTFYGPQVSMGNGNVRSWVTITHEGKPKEIGLEMTAAALQGLPAVVHDHSEGEFVLPLHYKAQASTTFDHIGLNWNPGGHPPPGIYTVPHFDVHFYMMPLAERMMIPAYSVDPSGFDNWPAPGYIPYKLPTFPPNDPARPYFNAGGGEAMMGTHWVNLRSPEFNGQPFSHTFIYGSYDGKVTFYEPMITKAFIESKVATQQNFVPATLFDPDEAWYPTSYNIWYDPAKDRYYISLGGFTWR
jgi:hypothetical protein